MHSAEYGEPDRRDDIGRHFKAGAFAGMGKQLRLLRHGDVAGHGIDLERRAGRIGWGSRREARRGE